MLVHIVKPRYASPTIQLASFSPAKRWGTLFVPLLVGPSTVRHLARTKKDRKGAASSSLGCLCVCVMFFFFFFPKGEREILWNWTRGGLGAAVLAQHRAPQCYGCVSFLNVCMLVGVCVYSYVRGKRERDMALWCQCCPHFFVLSFQSIRFSFWLKIRLDWIKREIQNLFWVDFKWKRRDEDTLVEWISKWK